MSCRKLVKKWSQITGQPAQNMKVAVNYKSAFADADGIISRKDMKDWKLRECDRVDTIDWMPCRLRATCGSVRVYYVNINPKSSAHKHSLVLSIVPGRRAQIDEWDGPALVSSVPAAIARGGESPPSDDELLQMMGEFAQLGINHEIPFTIDGKEVLGFAK